MPWFRIDDGWHSHPKVMLAGNAAAGLWARCGAYCAQHNLEGRIPIGIADAYGARKEIADLLRVGLWVRDGDVYVMPDWLDYNPSAESVKAKRKADADRQRRAREAAASRRDTDRDSQRDEAVSHGPPGPARPGPADVSNSQQQLESVPGDLPAAAAEALNILAEHRILNRRTPPDDPDRYRRSIVMGSLAEHHQALHQAAADGNTDRWIAEHVLGVTAGDVITAAVHIRQRNAS